MENAGVKVETDSDIGSVSESDEEENEKKEEGPTHKPMTKS
jgi:hypothetical protein